MTKLYYITHPSVYIQKDIDISEWDIDEKGKLAILRLLKFEFWKDIDFVYTSEEKKAYKVAENIKEKFGIDYSKLRDLGEADRSSTGLISPPEEYMKLVRSAYDNIALGVKGWESHLDMMVRNAKALEMIKNKHRNHTFAIIGHGGAGTTLKCYIKGILPSFNEDPQKTGCYFIADLDENKIISDWQQY